MDASAKILRAESLHTEFKVRLPDDAEKYVKTIIAFANTQGGKLIVGIDDKTREVVGVDADSLFRMMDSIADAVSDSCTPQIVPNIELRTVAGKTVIVVSVDPGPNRPYYLKSKGKENGTFIRVAGTSRPAHPEKIRELEMEGARISWDELACVGYKVTEEAVQALCGRINAKRQVMWEQKQSPETPPPVTLLQLVNWNVVKKTGEGHLATNAFALLTGTHFPHSKTQCAVFAGKERGEFLDKKDFDGPLSEQIDAAYAFVLRNIRLAAKVEGLVRREKYELPPAAIREMIINAHCHRNFLVPSCVQVALYEDRLEVTSPGGLCCGLTLEEALSGSSVQRNRVVAKVFSEMGLIEAWGTGLGNIRKAAKAYGLPNPEFIEMPNTFRVHLYRKAPAGERRGDAGEGTVKSSVKSSVKGSGKSELLSEETRRNGTKKRILAFIAENNLISAAVMADKLSISLRAVEKHIKELRDAGILIRHGSARGGSWEIAERL